MLIVLVDDDTLVGVCKAVSVEHEFDVTCLG